MLILTRCYSLHELDYLLGCTHLYIFTPSFAPPADPHLFPFLGGNLWCFLVPCTVVVTGEQHLVHLFVDLRCFDPEGSRDGGPVGEGNPHPEDEQRLRPHPGQRTPPADHPPAGLCPDERYNRGDI